MYDYRLCTPRAYATYDSVDNIHGSGSSATSRYDRFQFHMPRIDTHPNYVISRDGYVYEYGSNNEVLPSDDRKTIVLDGERCDIDYLLLRAYIGNLPFPVIPRNKRPITRMYYGRRCTSLTYRLPEYIIDENDPSILYFDKIPFKIIPFAKYPIVISRNGVIIDLDREDFVMKSFSSGFAMATFVCNPEKAHELYPDCIINFLKPLKVSQVLYLTYRGSIPKGLQVGYIDNIKYHDDLDNLVLRSTVENIRNARANSSRKIEFSRDDMKTVVRMLVDKYPNAEIAKAINFDFKEPKDKHRFAAIVYKLRHEKGYYDDLCEEFYLDKC